MGFVAHAQSGSHIKFMGIPMGISIGSFQAKLAAKGVKYSPTSKHLHDAVRVYEGKFAGYDAELYVYYDSKTKLVYRAKAVIERSKKDLIDNLFIEFVSMLIEKYGSDNVYVNTDEDETEYSMRIETDNGRIDLYETHEDPDYYFYTSDYYLLHIDYFDDVSQSKNLKSRMEDL